MITNSSYVPAVQKDELPALEVDAELVNILYRQSISAAIGTFITIAVAVYVLWPHVRKDYLLMWCLFGSLLAGIRLTLAIRHKRTPPPAGEWRKNAWRFTLLTAVAGCSWAALALVFFTPDNLFVTVFICLLLAGITSSGVASLSSFWPAYCALAIPALAPVALRAIFLPNENLIGVIGILLLLLLIVNLGYCRNMQRVMRESVSMRFENLALIRQITQEKERAESANRAKSQFLAAASHDLRQPTHALALFVAALRALALRPELKRSDVENIAERLQGALKNLGQLLNALLDVSRLDAGVVETNKRPIALQETLQVVFDEFSGPARSKGVELTVVPASLWVDSDPIVLHRILSNLVSNAVRYTQRGRILVGCRRHADSLEIQVWDTGIGISDDQLPKIFQEFYQVHNVARDREQGLGLGLAIVQRLAKLLDTEIEVRSMPGKGSVFTFRLPLADAPVLVETKRAALEAPRNTGKTILAIDDDPDILEAIQQLLAAWGHTAVIASTLEQALQKADQHKADISLILSDYRLAEHVNGADAIRAVTARLGRQVPAVIITGDTSPERIRETSATGFKLLHKPLAPEQLHQVVCEL